MIDGILSLKQKKLKGKTLINNLFSNNKSVYSKSLKITYLLNGNESTLLWGVSVSKKRFKRAVDRNFIKRLLREACRKEILHLKTKKGCVSMFVYLGKTIPSYKDITQEVQNVIMYFNQKHHEI